MNETIEDRNERRRKRDRFMEFIRVFWPIGIAVVMMVTTWAELRVQVTGLSTKVEEQKRMDQQVLQNTTEIAVLKANVVSIKENVDDVKRNTERIINRLDRGQR